jgi:hypothetical protein
MMSSNVSGLEPLFKILHAERDSDWNTAVVLPALKTVS